MFFVSYPRRVFFKMICLGNQPIISRGVFLLGPFWYARFGHFYFVSNSSHLYRYRFFVLFSKSAIHDLYLGFERN